MKLATPPVQQDTGESVDRNLWLYELCRFLVHRTNRLIVSFFADSPPCSSQTCPEMRASEWQYLCAVHEPPKSCCAIDYCCHTLDWAANVLTSSKHFPSRLSLGGEGGNAYASMKQLTNIFRRVYRIYAHAWFQHREVFWSLEQEEGLYKFFKTVCDAYSLIPEDNYTVPPEAEGDREDLEETPISQHPRDMQILRNETPVNQLPTQPTPKDPETPPTLPPTGATTRRHRHTPSTGTQVTSIEEGPEEEEEDPANTTQRQISQQIPSDPLATSTDVTQPQLSSSPPKQSRSPRPEMSISMADTKPDFHVTENPTPTPERHNLDPFDESAVSTSTSATSPSSEGQTLDREISSSPPKSLAQPQSNTSDTNKEPPTPLSAINTNQPTLPSGSKTPEAGVSPTDEGEVLRSPGGGSIRTISGDFLSGILAHCDVSDDNEAHQTDSSKDPGSTSGSEDGSWSLVDHEKKDKEPETTKSEEGVVEEAVVESAEKEQEKAKESEDDEEMGEIKLENASDPTTDADAVKAEGTDVEKVEDESKKEDDSKGEPENKDESKDETPAGVV